MSATGTATIDFGAYPGTQIVTTTVIGQAAIGSSSHVEAFLMGESTADHSVYEHNMVPMTLRCGNIVVGTGFDIVAACTQAPLTGQWSVHWVWV